MNSVTAVSVVGAGPTGLMLADDLARAGLGCTVLERRGEVTNLTRAFAVHARTLELLDARGLADDLVATGARVGELRVFGQLEVDLSRLPPRFPYVLRTADRHPGGVGGDQHRPRRGRQDSGALVPVGRGGPKRTTGRRLIRRWTVAKRGCLPISTKGTDLDNRIVDRSEQ